MTDVEMGTTITVGEMHYTLDGTEPTAVPRAPATVSLDKTDHHPRRSLCRGQRVGDVMTEEFVRLRQIAVPRRVAANSPG